MREYPWLERPVSWSHFRIFEAILDRLALAKAWEGQLPGSAFVERAKTRFSKESAQWIENFSGGTDEAVFSEWSRSEIGGLKPEEALFEFGRASREIQIELAREVKNLAGVERVSQEQGAKSRSRHWAPGSFQFSGAMPSTLSGCALGLHQSALGWIDWPSNGLPLVERDIPGRFDWVLLECPHRDPLIRDSALADFLCSQNLAWFQGLAGSLDFRLRVMTRPRESDRGYCRLSLVWGEDS